MGKGCRQKVEKPNLTDVAAFLAKAEPQPRCLRLYPPTQSLPAMRLLQAKKGWYLLSLPFILGMALYGIANAVDWGSSAPPSRIQEFEFTVWRDTLHGFSSQNGLTITLSEREKARASLLVLQNQRGLLPFHDLEEHRFHLLVIGEALPYLEEHLGWYAPFTAQRSPTVADLRPADFLAYDPVVVAFNQPREGRFALEKFVRELQRYCEVVVVNFGDLGRLEPLQDVPTLVQVPHARRVPQEVAAQLLFGGVGASRPLPDDVAAQLDLDQSFRYAPNRLAYAEPEYVGVSSDSLAKIEAIVREGIDQYAMPGAQVLVAYRGHVIYHRAFGYHTYYKRRPVQLTDLYDLASLTKVAATTLGAMRLVEEGKMDLQAPLRRYFRDSTFQPSTRLRFDTVALAAPDTLPLTDSTAAPITEEDRLTMVGDTLRLDDSTGIVVRVMKFEGEPRRSLALDVSLGQLMTHHSGLPASLPIAPYLRRLSSPLYSPEAVGSYTVPVADHLYLKRTYLDSLWNDAKSLRPDSGRYRYSCVNMILVQQAIDSLNQGPLSQYLDSALYGPMGLQTLGYNPAGRLAAERLIPTAEDRWRGQMLCGTVHDPTAALLGGVSGNAGLFSNANDLAILGQMLLNGGSYGGAQYFQPETVFRFTQRRQGHRGFGWDKPPFHQDYIVAPSASPQTFGHTGFTGTCFWVDPEHEITFVFLSNRVHPNQNNQRINQLRIRQRVHQAIYDALGIPPRFEAIPEPRETRRPEFLVAMEPQG